MACIATLSSRRLAPTQRMISSKGWVHRQLRDPYVVNAKLSGLRSRAAFKLLDLQDRYRIIKAGDVVVDLGCSPGGWAQVAAAAATMGRAPRPVSDGSHLSKSPSSRLYNRLDVFEATKVDSGAAHRFGSGGDCPLPANDHPPSVLAVDLLAMEPLHGVRFIQGNFTEMQTQNLIRTCLRSHLADVVLSDMAHSFTGDACLDSTRQLQLCWTALCFAVEILKPGGNFLVKARYGDDYALFRAVIRDKFHKVIEVKPPSSRAQSAETYCLCLKAVAGAKLRTFPPAALQWLREHGVPHSS